MASRLLLEVSLSVLECTSAKLVFTIRSSEVFTLRSDLLYIFLWELLGGHSESSLVRGNSLVRGFVFRGSTVCSKVQLACSHDNRIEGQ